MAIIEINNLNFGYTSDNLIIKDLNLSIEEGEYVTLLGHNGSGKSTLSKLLIGLLEAKSGTIKINNLELNEENVYKIREKIGIVFQNPDNQFVGVTVEDDIAFGLENRNIPQKEMKETILEYAKLVGMEEYLKRNPETLSGGQKQRVAIASVLAFKPDIIIFDEATSMLDPNGVNEVLKTIRSLVGKKTIISITHNLNEARFADRVVILNDGKVVLNGKPTEVFKNKQVLLDSNLDITESMKLIEKVNDSDIDIKNKEKVEAILWELTFQK